MAEGVNRLEEKAREFSFELADDHRAPWEGGPKVVLKPTKNALDKAGSLLKAYQAVHGDWREVTVVNENNKPGHAWEFTPCQCPVCHEAEKLVGHPARPNGE